MKIYEITRPPQMLHAKDILKRAGYKQIGSGAFGSALSRPDRPFILKLFNTEDQAYLQYLKLVTTISNPHFPIVKGKPTKVNDNYWAVQLERLTPLTRVDLIYKCQNYIYDFRELRDLEQEHLYNIKNNPDHPAIDPYIIEKRNSLKRFKNKYPDLAEALELILKHVIDVTRAKFDVHDGNFLMRGKTLVITDPVAFHKDASQDISPTFKTPKQLGFTWNDTSTPTISATPNNQYPETMPQSGLGGAATPPLLRRLNNRFRTADNKLLSDLYTIPVTKSWEDSNE